VIDVLGTFNRSQFERLLAYVKGGLRLVGPRLRHLTIEQMRVGTLTFVYDTAGKPTDYRTGGSGAAPTYIGKLMAAYEVLGGDPFYDLQVRAKTDPVYLPKGTESATSKVMSNGEPIPQSALSDGPSANAIRDIRRWMVDDMDRLERLERKIRRMVDYADQLQEEIDLLNVITGSVESDGSLDNLIQTVQQLLADPGYRAIADDQGKDPFGKFIYAPMSTYEPSPDRIPEPGVSIERTNSGYVVAGDTGVKT
jgi:hypothetical protein